MGRVGIEAPCKSALSPGRWGHGWGHHPRLGDLQVAGSDEGRLLLVVGLRRRLRCSFLVEHHEEVSQFAAHLPDLIEPIRQHAHGDGLVSIDDGHVQPLIERDLDLLFERATAWDLRESVLKLLCLFGVEDDRTAGGVKSDGSQERHLASQPRQVHAALYAVTARHLSGGSAPNPRSFRAKLKGAEMSPPLLPLRAVC